ncbi:MAG: calcium-binding protein [Nitrospira sp.]|nr:MAG: calcium-binding protein [Nitrospira sp.]
MATILGTSGPNVINGTNDPGDVIFARAGHDLVNANAGNDLVFGELGNDVLIGGFGDDRLNGGLGNDTLNGGAGTDTADYSSGTIDPPGPIGPQPIIGATAGVTVNLNLQGVAQNTGGAGIDTLIGIENAFGTNFDDILTGNSANNVFSGLAGNDTLLGGGGNDTLNGGIGNDILNGGTGSDTASYTSATANVSVNLNLADAQNTGGADIDTLVSIENIIGTNFNDTLIGNSGDNVLTGLAGNDTLNGGDGNDRLNGGSGNDVLNGGTGNDTADYSTATAGVTVIIDSEGPGEEPQNTGGAGIDQLVSIESLIGSTFNDRLHVEGLEDNHTINGGNGNDHLSAQHNTGTLNGEAGDDVLEGGNGFARLNGGAGNDHLNGGDGGALNGGDGNDLLEAGGGISVSILNGGAGADTLHGSGGAGGNDTYDYNAVSDSPAGGGRDTIVNFFVGEMGRAEQIDLTDVDANSVLSGNQAFIWGGPFTAGHLRYNTTTGILSGNTDGDAAAEFEIQLLGVPALVVGGADTHILL